VTVNLTDPIASVFISYTFNDRALAQGVQTRLDQAGYRVWIDEGELRAGDSLVTSISQAIDKVDFLVALVSEHSVQSNWCQQELSLAMTGEIAQRGITVIPIKVGDVQMPPTLIDKKYLKLAASSLDSAVAELVRDLRRHLEPPAPLPPRRRAPTTSEASPAPLESDIPTFKIIGVDLERLGKPSNDGSRGSALYMVPFELDGRPDYDWGLLLVQNWDHPSSWTTMHRPGIARVTGATIELDGTTMDEVRQYHLSTLKGAVRVTNEQYIAAHERARVQAAAAAATDQQHRQRAAEITRDLDFD
jgi:hypothetical protein